MGHRQNFNEKILNGIVAELMNEIAENLTLIETETVKDYEKDSTVIQAHNELIEVMENPESEIEDAINRIMNLASVKFTLCKEGDNTAVTERIKTSMAIYPKKANVDGEVIEKIVRKIRMYPNKQLAIEFINGKEFERKASVV